MKLKQHEKLNTFQQVRELPKKPALAFSAALLERMLINYQLFCELNDFGDATVARNVVNLIWEYVKAPKSKINVGVQSENIEEITPDVANFDNFGVYPALDFCMALQAALQLVADEDVSGAVTVSKLSQGGCEAYILTTSSDELTNIEIKQHPLMQFEVEIQQLLLKMCEQRPVDIEGLNEFLADELVSNIGLSLS